MQTSRVTSPLLRVALASMCGIWTTSGWFFIATRRFTTKPTRLSVETTVDGLGAVFAGSIFVALGLIALAILLQGTVHKKENRIALVTLLFVIPATFVLIR